MTDKDQIDTISEPGLADNATHDGSPSNTEESSDESSDDGAPQSHEVPQAAMHTYHKMKWKRLKKHYNDQYLDLFNATHDQDINSETDPEYADSQIGAVTWTSKDKELFFSALDRFGRHDLPQIAIAIKTKSQIEVRDYFDTLHQAHVDRQLFQRQTNNVSHAEIPPADEVGEECEQVLDAAADALAAFQEQYDMEAGLKQQGSEWLIDRNVALLLDATTDNLDLSGKEDDADQEAVPLRCHQLFHLGKLLDLSEEFFMNSPADSHWQALAEKGQRPALTQGVVDDLYNLLVGLTQRVIQVAIFMAKSRIRAHMRPDYLPSRSLMQIDVEAALDVLKMSHNAWNFWTLLPRRNQLEVISGSHSKGVSRRAISYEDAESILSVRQHRGRRRSLSLSTDGSSSTESESDDRSEQEDMSLEARSDHAGSDSTGGAESSSADISDESRGSPNELSSGGALTNVAKNRVRLSRAKRSRILEDAQDEYMERLDQEARGQKEDEIWQLLGRQPGTWAKHEEEELGFRPKTLRKTEQELRGWVCTYGSEWERFGEVVPDEAFIETARAKKSLKRKTVSDEDDE